MHLPQSGELQERWPHLISVSLWASQKLPPWRSSDGVGLNWRQAAHKIHRCCLNKITVELGNVYQNKENTVYVNLCSSKSLCDQQGFLPILSLTPLAKGTFKVPSSSKSYNPLFKDPQQRESLKLPKAGLSTSPLCFYVYKIKESVPPFSALTQCPKGPPSPDTLGSKDPPSSHTLVF